MVPADRDAIDQLHRAHTHTDALSALQDIGGVGFMQHGQRKVIYIRSADLCPITKDARSANYQNLSLHTFSNNQKNDRTQYNENLRYPLS